VNGAAGIPGPQGGEDVNPSDPNYYYYYTLTTPTRPASAGHLLGRGGEVKYLTIQEIQCVGPADCESRLELLMDALLYLEEADAMITDPDLAADTATRRMDVQMIVDGDDPAVAMVKALATVRAAIHAIGYATPGWETSTAVMHVAPADAAHRLLATT
jgi:hypothetical protein